MTVFPQKSVWFWIAFAALVIALAVLIIPNAPLGVNADQPLWLVLLPALFIGLIVPLGVLPLFALLTLGHASPAPALGPLFQRPPPVVLALS
jgi:bacteriorhodopsin